MPSRFLRVAAPVVILGVLLGAATLLLKNPPEPVRRPPAGPPPITVETEIVEPVDYQVVLDSFGTVQPSIRTQLVAQVGGQVVWVSPSLREGGYFGAGESLLRIDARDYEADLAIAEAELIDARRGIIEAQAQAEQARDDWANLGRTDEPSPLVLRRPQLLAAQARLKAAEAAMAKAELALGRTAVSAPFAGRVLEQRVDLGQVVPPNTAIAEVYATDAVEVRLPLRNRDLAFIDLPEQLRLAARPERREGAVVIESRLGGEAEWIGDLVRTEGAIDDSARQLHVIARIEDPFGAEAQHERPLKIGEYVMARLAGRVLSDAIVIPNEAIYQGSYVYRVEDGILRRSDIEILWQNEVDAVIGGGLAGGDELVLTPLGQVSSGMPVQIEGEQPRPPRQRASRGALGAAADGPERGPSPTSGAATPGAGPERRNATVARP